MSEEIPTPKTIARQKHLRYLAALYRLGLHDTLRMMEDGEEVYRLGKHPYSLKFY